MRVLLNRRISTHKMWWRVWQGEGQTGAWCSDRPRHGRVALTHICQVLDLEPFSHVLACCCTNTHHALSLPHPHHILCLDMLLVNTTLISAHACNFGAQKFCDDMTCVLPSISQPNLYQIQLLGGVLESSGPAESKTVIEIQFWVRFHGEKWENVRDKWNCGYCSPKMFLYSSIL